MGGTGILCRGCLFGRRQRPGDEEITLVLIFNVLRFEFQSSLASSLHNALLDFFGNITSTENAINIFVKKVFDGDLEVAVALDELYNTTPGEYGCVYGCV